MTSSGTTMLCVDDFYEINYGFSLSISDDGELYLYGRHAMLLDIKQDDSVPLKLFPSLNTIKAIDCGNLHVICLDVDGNVYTFGSNDYGQLGIGPIPVKQRRFHFHKTVEKEVLKVAYEPQKVELPPIKNISSSKHSCFCVSEDGELFSFGFNSSGELGHGDCKFYNYPKKIESLENVDYVECGNGFVICCSLNNEIYGWGSNYHGQLGVQNRTDTREPMKCLNWPKNITDIKCGDYHVLVLTSNHEVYSCGNNYNGQLGRKSERDYDVSFKKIDSLSEYDIIRIACGNEYSMCFDDNNLFVFGDNQYGQLGLGDTTDRKEPTLHPTLSNIIDMSSRGNHTFVKTSNNEIYAFGHNNLSQLGIQINESPKQTIPIRVLEGKEEQWCSFAKKSRAKSARK